MEPAIKSRMMRKFTTGKVFLGREIPAGELRQDMLRDDVELRFKDIGVD